MDINALINRINELSRKDKTIGLTPDEVIERTRLRKEYLDNFKRNFRQQLDSIEWTDGPEREKEE
ncbi:hypothetical protein B8V81_4260 [Paenibacillus pasadenensis]|uniref:UPF0291 protein B8V81_4260 n=1 Tax=Paenibacillus pasadenensis TaxID=217090 RepID=A0A2N5N6B6_9BACL|nr:DUF896 domain-containing protein [Paenibacillus pasadenensis]PLT45829.1 hypothetical protein B8V81_4260 [Paenibacillus pasadenensis]